jgi:hypothetical protein
MPEGGAAYDVFMAGGAPILSRDPTAGIECHRPDDRFIPVRSCEMASALVSDADRFGTTPDALRCVAGAVEDLVDQEVASFERTLADRYAGFNPDRDTVPQADLGEVRTPQGYRDLLTRLDYLLTKANFSRLSESDIQHAVETANSFGLRVQLHAERLVHLSVWVRGHTTTRRFSRSWRHPLRGQPRELTVYRRLAVITQLNDDPFVNLKLFKEIPICDVEALLPHADVRMSWIDRLKLFGGGAGMIGSTGLKVVKLLGTIVYWSRLLWVVLAGAAVLTYRAITGYRYARTMRDSMRTRHLYYQNLDNNAGVIHALISMIAQEEFKEAILAWCFCHGARGSFSSAEDLRDRVESYLDERFRIPVHFDVEDALETLSRWELWADRERLAVLDPETVEARLRDHWRRGHSVCCHEQRAAAHSCAGDGGPSGTPLTPSPSDAATGTHR